MNIPTGEQIKYDSINIAIDDIRNVNTKLIERKYYIDICNEQENIIELNKLYISKQDTIIKDLQNRIVNTTDLNYKLQEDYNRQRKKTIICGSICGVSCAALAGVIIGLIFK